VVAGRLFWLKSAKSGARDLCPPQRRSAAGRASVVSLRKQYPPCLNRCSYVVRSPVVISPVVRSSKNEDSCLGMKKTKKE